MHILTFNVTLNIYVLKNVWNWQHVVNELYIAVRLSLGWVESRLTARSDCPQAIVFVPPRINHYTYYSE